MRRLWVLPLIGVLLVGGCGGGGSDRPKVPDGAALTIYTSLPMHGDSAPAAAAVLEGEKLALAEHGGRAGRRAVKLVALDSSKADSRTWDPAVVEKNAERAADDSSAIAYLGELDLGGSAVSVPVTNDKHIPQISPLDGLTSLTEVQPGGARGGPERYYPDGHHTFARLVPTDLSAATALVDWAHEQGARRIAIVHDDHLYGRGIAAQAVFVADARKVDVGSVKEVQAANGPAGWTDAAKALASDKERPDAVVYAGATQATAATALTALHAALPGVPLYAAGVSPDRPLGPAGTVAIVTETRPATEYPRSAQRVLRAVARRLGRPDAPVAALYGYEAMRLTLAAIDRAAPHAGDRAAVTDELLRRGPRPKSVLGDLAFTSAGDVADQRVAAYRRDGRELAFEGLRTPRPPQLTPAPGDPGS